MLFAAVSERPLMIYSCFKWTRNSKCLLSCWNSKDRWKRKMKTKFDGMTIFLHFVIFITNGGEKTDSILKRCIEIKETIILVRNDEGEIRSCLQFRTLQTTNMKKQEILMMNIYQFLMPSYNHDEIWCYSILYLIRGGNSSVWLRIKFNILHKNVLW